MMVGTRACMKDVMMIAGMVLRKVELKVSKLVEQMDVKKVNMLVEMLV
jgi:hypothetical protein